jgi:hypothetical protein
MKLVGFSISKDCIALEREADYFDLHNNFDFIGLAYSSAQRTLDLFWHRGTGDWVKPTEPAKLRLVFSEVYLFKTHERDLGLPFTEDDCLDSIGFLWNDMLAEMGSFTSNEPKEGCTHLIAIFMSNFSIKVGAESVALHVTGSA